MGKESIKTHEDLELYQVALFAAMEIFEISKKFPVEERYSITDQICRSDFVSELTHPVNNLLLIAVPAWVRYRKK